MSKTPLKQADQTLVQGAYNAAIAGTPQDGQDGMAQGMDKLMEISGQAVKDIVADRKAKKKEGDDLANDILEKGGSLGTSWFNCIEDEVSGMHDQYSYNASFGKNKENKMIMQEQNELGALVGQTKDLTTAMAEAQEQKDWSNSVSDREQGVFNAFMNNNSKKRVGMVDGKRVLEVETPEGWMSTNDIERMMNEHKQDFKTMANIREQAINVSDKAKEAANRFKSEGVEGEPFDMVKTTSQMDNTLRNANLKSLMHDDVLENGIPFVEAIKTNPQITGMTYESLGIDPSLANRPDAAGNEALVGKGSIDLNKDGVIQPEELTLLNEADQALITDALTNPDNDLYDEERTRGLMAGYFADFVKQQYDKEYTRSTAIKKEVNEDNTEQFYALQSDGTYAPVSLASDRFKNMTKEELLAMYPPKQ